MTGIRRRHQDSNVPIEVMRTAVEIAEQGSYTKAAERLQLGQPAVSAQIKRLQALVGGPIFARTANRLQPTARGALVIAQARRILESNDHILSLGGAVRDMRPIRLGLSSLYAAAFCQLWQRERGSFVEPISVRCDEPAGLTRLLADGYLDVACMLHPPRDIVCSEWREPFLWARAPQFVVSPGTPLPLVSAVQDDLSTNLAVEALDAAKLGYRLVFESADFETRVAAASAGLGVMVLPARQLPPSLMPATDYYLPKVYAPLAGVCVRRGTEGDDLDRLIGLLGELRLDSSPAKVTG
jgi:DNA-binding transcriptional LysR family regulator